MPSRGHRHEPCWLQGDNPFATMQTLPSPSFVPLDTLSSDFTPTFRVHPSKDGEPPKRILLLEDDPAFKEIMTDFLTENGYNVVGVQNGVEGVHQVLAGDFEVILCDMLMPT